MWPSPHTHPVQSSVSSHSWSCAHTTHYSLTPLWLYKQAHLIFVVLSSFFFFSFRHDLPTCHRDQQIDQRLPSWVLSHFGPVRGKSEDVCANTLFMTEREGGAGGLGGWVASDTTSKTTHQTNTLKALSTLTLRHWMCVIRAFIDISAILELTFEVRV